MYRGLSLCLLLLSVYRHEAWELDTLKDFDIHKYSGRWYQVYSAGIKGETIPEIPKAFCSFFDFNVLNDGKVEIVASTRPDAADNPPVHIEQVGQIVEPGILEFEQDTEEGKRSYKYFVEKVGPVVQHEQLQYDYAIIVTQFEDLKMFLVASREPKDFKKKYNKEVMDFLTKNRMLENDMKTCKPISKYLIEHNHVYDCVYR